MVHLIIPPKKKLGMSKLDFHLHYRDIHGALFSKVPGGRRYVQNHFFGRKFDEELPYDALTDIWLDSEEAFQESFTSPIYKQNPQPDLPNFIHMGQLLRFLTEDHVLLEGPPTFKDTRLSKIIFFLKRKPGMDIEEFRRHWLEVHGPIVLKLPRLRRYVQCHVLPSAYAEGEPLHDGFSQLWFDNDNDLREAFKSLTSWIDLRPSTANFLDQDRLIGLVAEEIRYIWPEG